MRIKGLGGSAVPEIPGAGQMGPGSHRYHAMGPKPMGTLGPQGAGGASPGGAQNPSASQSTFAKRVMSMTPDKFAQLMQKLGAGPIS